MERNKSKRGKQPLYKTPEDLQVAVDRYFKQCEGKPAYDKKGVPVTKRNGTMLRTGETCPTITGLATFLGYKDRRTFTRQRERSQAFFDVVEGAKLRIEDYWEQSLYDRESYQGARYMLCAAFGWRQEYGEFTQQPGIQIVNRVAKSSGNRSSAVQSTNMEMLN